MSPFQLSRRPDRQDRFLDRFRPLSHRADGSSWARHEDTLQAANAYFHGLLSSEERKSMQPLANLTGGDYESLQQFVTDSSWDASAVMRQNARILLEDELVSPKALLVIDEVGWLKQGKQSVGVAHQYCGAAGKTANCQVAVDLIYSIPGEPRNADTWHFGIALKLYLPEAWAKDPKRRKKARVPRDLRFQTKPEIAFELVGFALEEGLPFRALTADATYGCDSKFRGALRGWRVPYVLGIQVSTHPLTIAEGTPLLAPGKGPMGRPREFATFSEKVPVRTPEQWAAALPKRAWKRVRWGEGTKGDNLQGMFARVRVRVVTTSRGRRAGDETGWLLLERRSNELKAYLCVGLNEASLRELVEIAHGRWVIEQFHQQLKGEVGFDHSEGRTWPGWHHHAAMVLMAYNYLQWERWQSPPGTKLPTLQEVHRRYVWKTAALKLEERFGLKKREAEREARRLWPLGAGG